jgi:ATP-dependent Clp protease ATP-binding subunit ClpA
VIPDAFEEAKRLGDGWIGADHFFLALWAEPSVARDVLEELGVTYDAMSELVRQSRAGSEHPLPRYDGGGLGWNPAATEVTGRAEAFAASFGHASATPEDWLLALIWDAHGVSSVLHDQYGASAAEVVAALRRRGVRVPEADPPVYRPMRGYRRVEVTEAEIDGVLKVLGEWHPPGSEWRWGFNWLPGEPRRAYVAGEDGVDLEGAVREAQARRDRSATN